MPPTGSVTRVFHGKCLPGFQSTLHIVSEMRKLDVKWKRSHLVTSGVDRCLGRCFCPGTKRWRRCPFTRMVALRGHLVCQLPRGGTGSLGSLSTETLKDVPGPAVPWSGFRACPYSAIDCQFTMVEWYYCRDHGSMCRKNPGPGPGCVLFRT